MSPETKFIIAVVICTLAVVLTLILIQQKHAKLVQNLTNRLDEAEKSQTKSLGEWSQSMGRHISDSIATIDSSTKSLYGQHLEQSKAFSARHEDLTKILLEQHVAHSRLIADRHEELTKTLHRQMEILANAAAAKHDEAISALGEQHRRNLEKLAERNEISNKELARQYSEAIASLKETIHEIEAGLEKSVEANRELSKSLTALRETLADAVKL